MASRRRQLASAPCLSCTVTERVRPTWLASRGPRAVRIGLLNADPRVIGASTRPPSPGGRVGTPSYTNESCRRSQNAKFWPVGGRGSRESPRSSALSGCKFPRSRRTSPPVLRSAGVSRSRFGAVASQPRPRALRSHSALSKPSKSCRSRFRRTATLASPSWSGSRWIRRRVRTPIPVRPPAVRTHVLYRLLAYLHRPSRKTLADDAGASSPDCARTGEHVRQARRRYELGRVRVELVRPERARPTPVCGCALASSF